MHLWIRKYGLMGMAIAGALIIANGTVVSPSYAQDKDKKKVAKKADAKDKRAWIKICEKVKLKEVPKKGEDEKKAKEAKAVEKNICMTHHESLSARTGQPIVSAAVRKVEGQEKQRFLVTIPLGMALPAGVHIKVDENEPMKFKYSFCHVGGCVAETILSEALMKQMRAGSKMIVAAIGISGKPVGFPVPLSGFAKAYDGKPIDSKKYAEARKVMMKEIRRKQIERATAAKKCCGDQERR